MKVALFSCSADPTDGWGRLTFEYCSELARRHGIDFTLYLPHTAPRVDTPFSEQIVYSLPRLVLGLRHPRRLVRYLRWNQLQNDVDLVHSLIDYPTAVIAEQVGHRLSRPCLVTLCGTYSVGPLFRWPDGWLLRRIYRRARYLLAISHFTARAVRAHASTRNPIEVAPLGIDTARFHDASGSRAVRKGYGGDAPILLTVGGLKPRKGQDVAIRAFRRVKRAFPAAQYLIVGTGRWREELEGLAKGLGLVDSVHFLGRVSDEALPAYYHACDVFVLTPRFINWSFEGFGLVYLEAAACGKASVASRSGGVEDAVIDGETGLLVPEGDVEATAEAVIRMLRDPELAHRLGESARARAEKQTVVRYVDKVLSVYQRMLVSCTGRPEGKVGRLGSRQSRHL